MSQRPSDADSARLAAIVTSSDDAIVSKDLNGIVTSWNRAAERIFGYAAEEMIGRSITLIIPVDRLDEEAHVLRRVRSGRPVDHFETIRQRKDGSLIPVSLTVSPIRDATGQVIGASKIARDISERRRIEAALAEGQRRQEDLQRRLVSLIAESGSLFTTPGIEQVMSGIVKVAASLVPADAYAVWRYDPTVRIWQIAASSGLSEAFLGPVPDDATAAVTLGSEPLTYARVSAAPLPPERREAYRCEGIDGMMVTPLRIDDRIIGAIGLYHRSPHTFSDVEIETARSLGTLAGSAIKIAEMYGEQRRSRERAEQANRQAALLAEASAALAGSLDYRSTFSDVVRLAVPHVASWCAIHVVNEHGDIEQLAAAGATPAGVDRESAEATIRTAAPCLSARVLSVPLLVHGHVYGALMFGVESTVPPLTDVDVRFAEDLAYRAALAVENARAYQQVSAANRAKDEFLATLSHELRTPLNAVLGWMRMLRSGTLSTAKTDRALEVVERNAVAQMRLVEDLLDLSRIITGKFRLDVQHTPLSAAIQAAVEVVQPAATAKEIDFVVDAGAGEVVVGDAARLQQAIWNLLSNAVKFTPRNGRVSVSVERRGGYVDVDVSDTGEGIAPDLLPFVFDRFRQGDSGTTRTHMGLGLGLAIVRHIVELHGGSASVSSAGRGEGSTFRISLPIAAVEEQAIGARRRLGASAVAPADLDADAIRVLAVDDDPDALDLLREVLEGHGMRVRGATSADDAVVMLERELPDIIVSDIAMPGHDGFELIKRVRRREPAAGGGVPAVAVTAYARPEDRAKSAAAGFQAHLAKPVDPTMLVAVVRDLVDRGMRAS